MLDYRYEHDCVGVTCVEARTSQYPRGVNRSLHLYPHRSVESTEPPDDRVVC